MPGFLDVANKRMLAPLREQSSPRLCPNHMDYSSMKIHITFTDVQEKAFSFSFSFFKF